MSREEFWIALSEFGAAIELSNDFDTERDIVMIEFDKLKAEIADNSTSAMAERITELHEETINLRAEIAHLDGQLNPKK